MPQPLPTPPTVVILAGDSLQVSIQCATPSTPERPAPINRLRRYGFGSPELPVRRNPAGGPPTRNDADAHPAFVIQTRDQHGRLLCQVVVAQ